MGQAIPGLHRPRRGPRAWLALGLSLAVHGIVGALLVGQSLWRAWPPSPPVDIEITGMRLEDLQDLPLGLPAGGERRSDAVVAPPPDAPAPAKLEVPHRDRVQPKPKPKAKAKAQGLPDARGGAGEPQPPSVRSYGPKGSRVTALLRIDRLRGTLYAPLVDGLLVNLPDRHDLLDGTGVDLYRDIDAILIATPDPRDARVTFLAVRHHLTDAEMRAALQRGARATGRELLWRTERGRPFAERRSVGAAAISPAGRDVRLILLAAPHLVVVTPPAYRGVILRSRPPRRAGGAADSSDGGVSHGNAGSGGTGDGTGNDNGADTENDDSWADLLGRIDAEDSVLPGDAVAMLSVVDLFSARGVQSAVGVGAGTRGSVDGEARAGEDRARGATVFGLPVPRVLTATLGVAPQPFAIIDAELEVEADAIRWESEWPGLRHKLLTNPLVVLTGFSGLVARATLERTAAVVRLRIDATDLETTRLLQLAASQLSTFRP